MNTVKTALRIPRHLLGGMEEQGRREAPLEACGYCAGRDGLVHEILYLRNVDQSAEHYSMEPREQFAAVKMARAKGLELLGVWHTHPASAARMSQEDIRLANDPNSIYLILSLLTGDLKAFSVDEEKKVSEVPLEIVA